MKKETLIPQTCYNVVSSDIDIRAFHVLYDHSILQEMRVKYLIDLNCLSRETDLLPMSSEIKTLTLELRNLALKKIVAGEKMNGDRIVKKCNEIKEKQIALIEKLLLQLKDCE